MPERSFDDFDPYAKSYRDIHTGNIKISGADSFYFAEMKIRILTEFEKNVPLAILDTGCGDGTTELYMHRYFPLWNISAIDISAESIDEARKKNISKCDFTLYDGRAIPFPGESFEVVFLAGVLHHIEPSLHQQLVQEIYRVLKPGGRVYIFEHNPFNPLTRHLVATCIFDTHAKLLKRSYIKNLLKKKISSVSIQPAS